MRDCIRHMHTSYITHIHRNKICTQIEKKNNIYYFTCSNHLYKKCDAMTLYIFSKHIGVMHFRPLFPLILKVDGSLLWACSVRVATLLGPPSRSPIRHVFRRRCKRLHDNPFRAGAATGMERESAFPAPWWPAWDDIDEAATAETVQPAYSR